jgi:hypothetical protein
MTARLISWPNGLKCTNFTKLKGPVSAGSKNNLTITGATQYVSAPTSPMAFSVSIYLEYGVAATRAEGMITALHDGSNALRFPWNITGKLLDPAHYGLSSAQELNWSNGEPWDNGRGWAGSYPTETVTAAAAKNTTIVNLGSTAWGDVLGMGDKFGFDTYFGVYEITETFPLETGKYRVWPPLRVDITTSTVATLEPTVIVKPIGEIAVNQKPFQYDPVPLTLVEIPDETVRSYYTVD